MKTIVIAALGRLQAKFGICLVDRAEDCFWSSYRYYELDDPSVLAMDWDGGWPIVW